MSRRDRNNPKSRRSDVVASLEKQETLEGMEEVANKFVKGDLNQYRLFKGIDDRLGIRGFRQCSVHFRRKVILGLMKTHKQKEIAVILGVEDFTVNNDEMAIDKNAHKSHKIKLYTQSKKP
jgi:hypothetical protein